MKKLEEFTKDNNSTENNKVVLNMDDKQEEKIKEKLAENKLIVLYLLEKANCPLNNWFRYES